MVKYLVITGGTHGIGAKTIDHFYKEGWEIINISRTKPISPLHSSFHHISVDLSKPIDREELHKKFMQIFANQTNEVCLVHNAAFYKRDSLSSLLMEDFMQTLQVNLIACVVLNQILIPFMLPGSCIIYIGTTLSEKAVPGSASYAISKHAAMGLMKVTCQDLIEQQIRACCICPGLVNTRLLKEAMDEDTVQYLLQNKIIGKRLIEPEEIARIIHFCASTPSMNGSIIHANLGQFAE